MLFLKPFGASLVSLYKNVGMKEWEWAGLEEIMSKDGE